MTNINKWAIPKNIDKPVERSLNGFNKPFETVYEIKNEYEVPSFEEFMETYKADEKVNYDDLESGSVGEVKGYGPCSSCSGSNRNLTFELKIILKNCMGGWKSKIVYNKNDARSEANNIVAETGYWKDKFLGAGYFSREDRRKLADRIRSKISWHEKGNDVYEEVCNKDPVSVREIDNFFDSLDMMADTLSDYPGPSGGNFTSFWN